MKNMEFKKISVILGGIVLAGFILFNIVSNGVNGAEFDREDARGIAIKRGHYVKMDETIKNGDLEIHFDRVVYGRKTVDIELSYKKEEGHEEYWLTSGTLYIKREDGEIEVLGGGENIGDDDSSEIKKSRLTFYIGDNDLRSKDKVSVKLSGNSVGVNDDYEKISFDRIELPFKNKILKKEEKLYSIDKEFIVEDIGIKIKSLEVGPITSFLDIEAESRDKDRAFGGIGEAYIIDERNNKYSRFGAVGISVDETKRKVLFPSSYYKTDSDMKLEIKGIWIDNIKEYSVAIDDGDKMKTDCEYDLDLTWVGRDDSGKIKNINIQVKDKRLKESERVNPRFSIYDVWIGDVKLEHGDYRNFSSTRYDGGKELMVQGIEIFEPIEGEVRFKVSRFKEYKKVDMVFDVVKK